MNKHDKCMINTLSMFFHECLCALIVEYASEFKNIQIRKIVEKFTSIKTTDDLLVIQGLSRQIDIHKVVLNDILCIKRFMCYSFDRVFIKNQITLMFAYNKSVGNYYERWDSTLSLVLQRFLFLPCKRKIKYCWYGNNLFLLQEGIDNIRNLYMFDTKKIRFCSIPEIYHQNLGRFVTATQNKIVLLIGTSELWYLTIVKQSHNVSVQRFQLSLRFSSSIHQIISYHHEFYIIFKNEKHFSIYHGTNKNQKLKYICSIKRNVFKFKFIKLSLTSKWILVGWTNSWRQYIHFEVLDLKLPKLFKIPGFKHPTVLIQPFVLSSFNLLPNDEIICCCQCSRGKANQFFFCKINLYEQTLIILEQHEEKFDLFHFPTSSQIVMANQNKSTLSLRQ